MKAKEFKYTIWTLRYNPCDGSFMGDEYMGTWSVNTFGLAHVLQMACKLFLHKDFLEDDYTTANDGEITLYASNGTPLMTLTPVRE